MKKLLFIIVIISAICPSIIGQTFQATSRKNTQQLSESSLEWMYLYNPDATAISGVGTAANNIKLTGACQFSTDFLANYVGKSISVVGIFLNTPLKDEVCVFMRKGSKINTAEKVAEKKVEYLSEGWNYVKFEIPVAIDGTAELALGYQGVDTGKYPLGFDGEKVTEQSSYLALRSDPLKPADLNYGNLMVRALVDGNENELANTLVLSSISCKKYAPIGGSAEFKLSLSNNTFTEIKNITLAYTANGIEKTKEITFDQPMPENSMMVYTLNSEPVSENTVFSFTITKVNGVINKKADAIEKTISAYDQDNAVERTILIEKFTGQECGYCPGGEKSIQKAIEGHEDHIVRIDHHVGFKVDIFTNENSESIRNFFNVKSAPQCMMNRAIQESRKDIPNGNGVSWHPGYMTEEMVIDEIAKPAVVSIDIKSQYNETNRELTVTVSGKGYVDMNGYKINVILTESGYSAYQNSGGSGYLHNDFPIVFLTDYQGADLVANEDGSYEQTFKCIIEETYGKVKVDLSKLNVVAFISEWNKKEDSEVMNAASIKVDASKTPIENVGDDTIFFYTNDKKVVANCECKSLKVYTVEGIQVANNQLETGIYIVKAIINNKSYTKKISIE